MNSKWFTDMQRRDFLAYGSSSVLSLAFLASSVEARAGAADTPADARAAKWISAGYAPGSAQLARIHQSTVASRISDTDTRQDAQDASLENTATSPYMVAAESLTEGDRRFAQTGARLSIHCPSSAEAFCAYPELALWALDVEFKSARCKLMFHAWCFQNDIVPQVSSDISFVVPVVDALNLTLSIKHTSREHRASVEPASRQQARLQFSLGRESNLPKLQRGVYFLALPHARTGALPKWNAYQMRAADLEKPALGAELSRRDRRRNVPALDDFAYLRLDVDYADYPSAPQV